MSADPSVDDVNLDEDAKDNDNKEQKQEGTANDLNLPEDLTQTTPQQQRKCMKTLGIKDQNAGDYWYAIDKKWYDSWTRYTMWNKADGEITGGIDNLHKIGEPRPGKIDNSSLQATDNPKALKRDIQENRTHIWIHEGVWKLFHAWYGGGPEFARKVFERGTRYSKEKYICIYPQLVKLVYCDDTSGEIDINKEENIEIKQVPPDFTLKQIADDVQASNAEAKENDTQRVQDDTPSAHIWLKFGDIKAIFPINKLEARVTLTAEDLENEDMNRYVEVPDNYLATKLDDMVDIAETKENESLKDFVIIIEKKQFGNEKKNTWPRAKGDDWRETLKTGDIIDVKDKSNKWYESWIRYVYPSDHEKAGKCIVHYIGWGIKWDEAIDISNKKRLSARHSHCSGPYRTRGYSYRSSGYSGFSYKQHETGTPDQHGVVGLCNLGNTCFMNSTIQCLAQSPRLTNYFLQNDYIHHINKNNPLGWGGRVAKAWSELLNDMFSGNYRTIAPRNFKNVIGEIAPRFMGYAQQDSQELLSFLLDGLHEDLNQIIKKPSTPAVESAGRSDHIVALESWKTYLKRNQSVIVDLLQAQYRSRVDCPDCGRVSVTFDPYMFLSVPLPTQKYKIIQYTWIDCNDTSKLPIMYQQKMLKVADIGMLKAAVAKKHGVNQNELFVCDVWRSKIHRELKKNDSVGNINRKSDDIFIYYSKRPTDVEEKKENKDNKENKFQIFVVNNECQHEAIGYPLLLTLPRMKNNKISVNEIRNKLWILIQPLLHNKDLKISDEKLPFEFYAISGYMYGMNSNCEKLVWHDENAIFNLNKTNLKFSVVWKDIKEYKSHLYEISERLKDKSSDNIELEADDDYRRGKPIELDACINAFCEKETLSENDAWYCSKCKGFKCASKKIDLWSSPDLLIIHLKRFVYTRMWRDRINTLVKFPIEGLDLSPFLLSDDAKSDAIYDLYAVSNHMGGMGGGHYTAYGKNLDNGEWYHLNDSGTSKVNNAQSIQSSNAYVLYYYKRQPRKLKHRASMVVLPEIKDDEQ